MAMLTSFDFGVDIGKEEREVFHEKLRHFVSAHENMLLEMQQTFDRRWDPMMWDPHTDTVSLELGTPEGRQKEVGTSIADVIGHCQLHNRIFYRITLCFASLVVEMESLTSEAYNILIPPLAMFDDDTCREEGVTDEEAQQGAGRLMSFLQKIWSWVQTVQQMVFQTLCQLASLYSPAREHDNYSLFIHVQFPLVWRSLSDLVGALVCMEEVLQTHDILRHGLSVYRKLLAQVSRNPERFEYDEITLENFCQLLHEIEHSLLDDGILQRLVTQLSNSQDKMGMVVLTLNKRFHTEFVEALFQSLSTVEGNVGTTREGDLRKRYVGILGMCYMYLHLFPKKAYGNVRRDLCKRVFRLHHQIPLIYIRGMHVFRPAAWMARRMSAELNQLQEDLIRDDIVDIKQACQKSSSDLIPQLNRLTTLVSVWISEMQTIISVDSSNCMDFLQSMTLLLQRGVLLAQHVQRLLVYHIALHNCADASLTLQHVDGVAHGLQLLMMIRAAYHTRTGVIATTFNLLVRSITYVMERHLYDIFLQLDDVKLNKSKDSVEFSAVVEAIVLLHKPQTRENLVCLDLVLSMAFDRSQASGSSVSATTSRHSEDILIAFSQLDRVVSYQTALQAATDCDFLYWHREAFYPLFFKRLYLNPLKSDYLPYLILAMQDCRPSILSSRHVENAVTLLDTYVSYIRGCIQKFLVQPLSTDVENDLRFYTHSVILGQPLRKIEAPVVSRDLSRFTRLGPIRFFNEWLHIATEVEHYLDAQFYNLNALMVNDWKTYEEMRNLALERYGLHICDGYLPGSVVDQGLDVLVITENIQVFVANYTYNMNEQLFVQRPSTTESKHLHTLHIRHIANSIRTHGTGIMNTTVNYVYKCLLKKLTILSQFLYDDHVKSRLIKDAKFFQTQKEELNGEYPISRAEKFIREMHKLGVAEDGQTFLSKFRHLVSEIGNALGYMRIMRSGGLRAVADSAAFLPYIDNVVHLERVIDPDAIGSDEEEEEKDYAESEQDMMKEEEEKKNGGAMAPPCTVQAVRLVDRVVQNMRKKLSDGSEYFRMLLEAVMKRLRSAEKYNHLKNFYMIIPPICVSHVELMIREKEQLIKKNKDGLFTDDGFALGCTFLLKLFGVSEYFESLHWFESVQRHYLARLHAMQESISKYNKGAKKNAKSKRGDQPQEDEEINNLHLTATMMEYTIREYAAVEEAFVSSKVFFHSTSLEENSDKNEEEEEES